MMDLLRSDPGTVDQHFEIAIGALVWARLSFDGALEESEQFDTADTADNRFSQFVHHHIDFELRLPQMLNIWDLLISLKKSGVIGQLDLRDLAIWHPSRELNAMPTAIADLLIALAGPTAKSSVYCPWDQGGQLTSRMPKNAVYVDIGTRYHPLLRFLALLASKPPQIVVTDPIREPSAVTNGKLARFDLAVACPPLGVKYRATDLRSDFYGRFPEKRVLTGTVLAVYHLLAQTSDRIVLLMPPAMLFSSGAEAALRKQLVANGNLQSVIALPEEWSFKHRVWANNVLILDPKGGHKSIRLIDARLFDTESLATEIPRILLDDGDGESQVTIDSTEALANDVDLQVSKYVLSEDRKQVARKLAEANTASLADVCQIMAPVAFPKSEQSSPILTMDTACFTDYGYATPPQKTTDTAQKVAKRDELYLQPNDIVISTKGTPGRVAIVPPDVPPAGESGWFAPRFAAVLRCDGDLPIDPRVLFLQLRSEFGQQLLSGCAVGATISMLRLSDLKKMQVVIPDVDDAKAAVTVFEKEVAFQQEIELLRQKQQALAASLSFFEMG
jgi:type I restriction enzyme M protein